MKFFRTLALRALALATLLAPTQWAQQPVASPCNQQAAISLSSSGTTTVITPAGNNVIHVCVIEFSSSASVNVTFVGVASGGNTNLSGAYQSIATYSRDFGGALTTKPAGAPGSAVSFGINLSSAATVGGIVTYYQSAQ